MALAELAATAEVDTVAQALFAEARHRRRLRRRRWAAGLFALALLACILGPLALDRGAAVRTGQRLRAGAGPASSPTPAELVVWTSDFRIEVISSASGRVIRTLATDVALNRWLPHPTVAPNGTVFFDDANDVSGRPAERILSVPLAGGPITAVAAGHYPVVSPNGRLLAYLAYTDITGAPEAIVVRNLRTGASRTWRYAGAGAGADITQLSWAPDSAALSFTASAGRAWMTVDAFTLALSGSGGSLQDARRIPLPAGMAWAGFVSATEGIGVRVRAGATAHGALIEPAIVEIATGRVVERLPAVRGLLATDNAYAGLEGTVQADPSGHHLAMVEVGTGNGRLLRWTIGAGSPSPIANGVLAAAWVPLAAQGS